MEQNGAKFEGFDWLNWIKPLTQQTFEIPIVHLWGDLKRQGALTK